MKYFIGLIIGFFLIIPSVKASSLAGFLDGNMYDSSTGTWQCQFLMDGNCYDLNENILTTRPTSSPVTITTPISSPTISYVPVYLPSPSPVTSPISLPASSVAVTTGQPVITPSCTLMATGDMRNPNLTWTYQGISDSAVGIVYAGNRVNGGIVDWAWGNQNGGYTVQASDRFTDKVGGSVYYKLQFDSAFCVTKLN